MALGTELYIRISEDEKAVIGKAAYAEDLNVAEYCRRELAAAAEKTLSKKGRRAKP